MQRLQVFKYFALAALFIFALSWSTPAQTAKRVQFQKGKTSVVVKGTVPRFEYDYDAYLVRARKGQTLSFRLITDDSDAYVVVFESELLGPDEDAMTPEGEKLRQWSGRLPVTSTYSVQVYGREADQKGMRKNYMLEISVK